MELLRWSCCNGVVALELLQWSCCVGVVCGSLLRPGSNFIPFKFPRSININRKDVMAAITSFFDIMNNKLIFSFLWSLLLLLLLLLLLMLVM